MNGGMGLCASIRGPYFFQLNANIEETTRHSQHSYVGSRTAVPCYMRTYVCTYVRDYVIKTYPT